MRKHHRDHPALMDLAISSTKTRAFAGTRRPGAPGTLPKCKCLTRHTFITCGMQRRLAVGVMHSGGDRLMLIRDLQRGSAPPVEGNVPPRMVTPVATLAISGAGYHLSVPFMHSIELPFSLTRWLFRCPLWSWYSRQPPICLKLTSNVTNTGELMTNTETLRRPRKKTSAETDKKGAQQSPLEGALKASSGRRTCWFSARPVKAAAVNPPSPGTSPSTQPTLASKLPPLISTNSAL